MPKLTGQGVWNIVNYALTAQIAKRRAESARAADPNTAAIASTQAACLRELQLELTEAIEQVEGPDGEA